jgi:heptosyltransferase-2
LKFPRILVKAPNWIGDAVLATPLLSALRAHWPDAHLGVLARAKVRPVVERGPAVDEIVDESVGSPLALTRLIAGGTWDLAISCSSSLRVAAALGAARIPVRIGFAGGGRHFFLTEPVPPPPRSVHQIEHYLLLGMAAGLDLPGVRDRNGDKVTIEGRVRDLVWRTLPGDDAEVDRFLRVFAEPGETFVAFAPGASFGPAKRWFAGRWAALGDRLALGAGVRVALVGGPDEQPAALAIAGIMARPPVNAAGLLTLGGTAALLKRCRAFVSNDSGLMHVGTAVGVPTIGLFGSSNPHWTGPRGALHEALWGNVPCSPCYRRTCVRGRDYGCLDALTVDQVAGAVTARLG